MDYEPQEESGMEESVVPEDSEENTERESDYIEYIQCMGQCPGCNDGSFYVPRDRYADNKRQRPEFDGFVRKIPPIGTTYEEFDEHSMDGKYKCIPCRGPDHVTNGPCTCLKEINYRARNKEQEKSYFEYRKYMEQIKPYGFIKKDVPADTFAPGLRVDVGDMIDLISRKDGVYEVRLCDGSERTGRMDADAIHVIEEPRDNKCCKN